MTRLRAALAAAIAVVPACASLPWGREETPLPPAVFNFVPTTASYAAVSHRTIERDVDGRPFTDRILLRLLLTSEIAAVPGSTPGDSGLTVTFVIDTILAATAPNLAPNQISQAEGFSFTSRMARTGRLHDPTSGTLRSPLLQQLSNQLSDFFPIAPAGGIGAVQDWVDTTVTRLTQDGADLTVSAVTNYRAAEWTDRDGARTLPVSWGRTYDIEGRGEQFGRGFEVTGRGTTTGTASFTASGIFEGSISFDELSSEIYIESMDASILLRQTQSDTVAVVRR